MELLFDEFADDQHDISFETLTIDCGELSYKYWEDEWVAEAIRSLRKELLAAHRIKKEKATEHVKLSEELLFFLQTGRLPWSSRITSLLELEQLLPDRIFIRKLKAIVREDQKVADRLVNSFSGKFIKRIIELLAEEKAATGFVGEEKNTEILEKNLASNLIKKLCREPVEVKESFLENKDVSKKEDTREIKREEAGHIYVHNAGVVLLHPFLEQLFGTLGLLREQQWYDELSPHRAAIVLEYLVSGRDEPPEFDLPLNKIFCGLEVDEVLLPTEPLSAEMEKECDDLLREVIQHWSALKNTGIEALRETFLQRNGKLAKTEKGWLLQAEQKAVDVLLGQLPWGIGVIKSSLMHDRLYVDWT